MPCILLEIKISSLGGNISDWINVLTYKCSSYDMENWFDEFNCGRSCDISSLRSCENAVNCDEKAFKDK